MIYKAHFQEKYSTKCTESTFAIVGIWKFYFEETCMSFSIIFLGPQKEPKPVSLSKMRDRTLVELGRQLCCLPLFHAHSLGWTIWEIMVWNHFPFPRILNVSFFCLFVFCFSSLQFWTPITLIPNTLIFHFTEKKQSASRLSTIDFFSLVEPSTLGSAL